MAITEKTSVALLYEESTAETPGKLRDSDTFLSAMTDAVRACQAFQRGQDLDVQVPLLISKLERWIDQERLSIKAAYLTIREHDMLFLVMQKATEFNPNLAESLTQLDLDIANCAQLQLVDLEVLAIPAVSEESVNAFMASGKVFTYAQ